MQSDTKTVLWILVGFIIAIIGLLLIEKHRDTTEAFLTMCPSGLNSYFGPNGDVYCCSGQVQGNTCTGTPKCSMTTNGSTDPVYGLIPACTSYLETYYTSVGKKVCPPSMPNYFQNGLGNNGCTNGPLNATLSGPASGSQPTCTDLSTLEENKAHPNSCYNQKLVDSVQCFGQDCTKTLEINPRSQTALITVSFTDPTGLRHATITRQSAQEYIEAVRVANPPNLNTYIGITEVAKAVYVDKTMPISEATLN
jgi:hypothetical protein